MLQSTHYCLAAASSSTAATIGPSVATMHDTSLHTTQLCPNKVHNWHACNLHPLRLDATATTWDVPPVSLHVYVQADRRTRVRAGAYTHVRCYEWCRSGAAVTS